MTRSQAREMQGQQKQGSVDAVKQREKPGT